LIGFFISNNHQQCIGIPFPTAYANVAIASRDIEIKEKQMRQALRARSSTFAAIGPVEDAARCAGAARMMLRLRFRAGSCGAGVAEPVSAARCKP
jgi:hypothetical protein